jgi:F0F1-type ATP synthase assembly protein I
MAKSKKGAPFSFPESAKSLQHNASRAGSAAAASYSLIGAIILLGGLGYGFDAWRGTGPWGLFVGLVVGIIVGFYELTKTMWRK